MSVPTDIKTIRLLIRNLHTSPQNIDSTDTELIFTLIDACMIQHWTKAMWLEFSYLMQTECSRDNLGSLLLDASKNQKTALESFKKLSKQDKIIIIKTLNHESFYSMKNGPHSHLYKDMFELLEQLKP